jgi:hypothetical protein
MRRFFTMLLAVSGYAGMAQTECNPGQVITTAPGSAMNTQRPHLYNRFDWTQPSFLLRAEQLTSPTITSPFYQGPWNSNVTHLVDSKDRLPADGWELINADFGYNVDGTPASQRVIDPKLLLYNKYTGTLRLFFAKGHTTTNDYNFIRIILSFYPTAGEYNFNTFTLSNSGILKALDVSDFNGVPASFEFMQDFQQTPGNWVYTDFPMHYDPCTCLFRSKILVQIRYLTNANVDLTGSFTGKLAAITNGQGSISNPDEFNVNFNGLNNTVKNISKAYKTVDGFISDLKKFNENVGNLDAFKAELKKSNFLKDFFATMPFVNVAVAFMDFFTGGGKSAGPQQVALTPTSIDLRGKIQGTISTDVLNATGVFITPGSDPTGSDDTKYPAYNNPMGVITLTKTPRLKWYTSVIDQNTEECCEYFISREDLLFDRTSTPVFEYAMNPASGLHVVEAEAALEIEYRINGQMPNPVPATWQNWDLGYIDRVTNPSNWTYVPTFVFDGYDLAKNTMRFRSPYYPMNCLPGHVFNVELSTEDPGVAEKIFLKVKFNLEKNSGTGQNVLLIQTYDLTQSIIGFNWDEMRNLPYIPHESTWNYNIKPEPVLNTCGTNNFQAASFASITAICNSDNYRNKHINTRTIPVETPPVQNENNLLTGVVYPNPVAESVHLKTTFTLNRNQVAITDVMGRRIDAVQYNFSQVDNGTLMKMNVKKLPAGVYFVQVRTTAGKQATYKFVKQ